MLKTNHLLPLLGLTLITLDSCTSSGSSASTSNPDTQTVAQNSVQEVALSEAQLEKARTNYANYCSGCHGEQMEAFTDRKWKHGSSAENLFAAIKHGYPEEAACPPLSRLSLIRKSPRWSLTFRKVYRT
ncbi:cytochrome c [Pontibacter sp. BAB1700]|uniref:c-type cytochrome n=1 Tax=Pontibacter sp. BAB1700 TaxID=1144253 RepID=UPI00026BC1A9|nr:cytochrome c [Pontibacter sp. BAB1700]EJF09769.1 glucose sorbosone dehydrogenase [Pontibacter sp. BAB1700]